MEKKKIKITKKKYQKQKRNRIIIWAIFTIILLIIGFFAYNMISTSNKITTSRVKNSRQVSFADQPSTILFLGVDGLDSKDAKNSYEKKERSGIQRSDTMILMDFNPETGVANMTSLMRDIKVPIVCDNNIEDKLGHSFSVPQKESNSLDDNISAGAECASNSIENKLGIPVDNYIYLNFSGFINIIDKLGGIDVNVIGDKPSGTKFCEQDEHGNGGNPTEKQWDVGKYCFVVGTKRHLNAFQALSYARHRHMDGDQWRNKRQQQIMKLVLKEMLKPSHLMNLSNLLDSLKDSIRSTIKISELLDFAKKHNEYLSDLDNSLLIKSTSIKYSDELTNGVYYADFDENDLNQKIKAIRKNLEIDKDKKSIPTKIENFDFDYYKYKE